MAPYYMFGKSVRSAHPMMSSLFCSNQGFVAVAASHFGRRLISSSPIIQPGQDDSTVSYLITSYGLPPEGAIKASNKSEFSDTQIPTLVRKHPCILVADTQKTLLPKLEFFCSIGISRLDLAKILTHNPWVLSRSMENVIRPAYSYLQSLGLSDVKVVKLLKRNSSIFGPKSKNVMHNIGFLRELGMPQSRIAQMVTHETRMLTYTSEMFSQFVGQVQQLGFDRRTSSFVQAMAALCGKETTWKRCEEAYRSWGWSDDDILSALRLWPVYDGVGEENNGNNGFLCEQDGLACTQDGLIEEKKLSLSALSPITEEEFLNWFVTRYLDQVPQPLNVFHGKMDAQQGRIYSYAWDAQASPN
ncbi:uncharacterized protein LOC126784166 [Argentina anserina]|uniref:uncharacterized protein LOC126784166 n=1 Tax=Argentina anserina TaxID=57926 RepID=UPI0021768187|nr:uncharacterized protein LOC126784166 [Potentilla anserina]